MSKLIIIRGNSGSGKTTIAKELRRRLGEQKTALLEQDYLRRHVLGEIGKGGDDNVELIELTTRFALEKNYVTILEGIMHSEYYGAMLKRLNDINPKDTYIFYLDIPLEETLQRHTTKPNSNDFGEPEIREWFREKDTLNLQNETVIDEKSTLEESVKLIYDIIPK